MAGVGLLGSVGEQLDKGTVVLEGYCILGHGQHLLALVEHYLGVSAIARPNHHAVRYRCCPFYLEHHRAVALCSFGGDILQCGGEALVVECTDYQRHLHAHAQFAHLRLVDRAHEEQVLHVGNGGDSGTVVEGVAQDNGVTDLNRHIQHCAGDGGAHNGVGEAVCCLRCNAVAGDTEVILCRLQLLAVGDILQAALVVGLLRDDLFAQQCRVAAEDLAAVLYIVLRQPYPRLCRSQLRHVGDNLDFRDRVAHAHLVAGFFVQFGYDTRNLRLDSHFVAGLHLARNECGALQVPALHRQHLIGNRLGARAQPEKDKHSHYGNQYYGQQRPFLPVFHIILRLMLQWVL